MTRRAHGSLQRGWLVRAIRILILGVAITLHAAALAQDQAGDAVLILRYATIPSSRAVDGAFVLGRPDAPVTVIEFADFICPHCQDYESVISQFITDYVATGKARFEYRLYPIVDPTYSPLTAQIAECADILKAGMFWPAHDLLFELGKNGEVGADVASVVAARLGLDPDQLSQCVPQARQFELDTGLGLDLGVQGTPAVMVRRGDGDPEWLQVDGETISRGGLPYEALSGFVEGKAGISTSPPEHLLNERLLHDTSLVTGEPCAAPCWHGIIPGETPWKEALEVLQSDTGFTDVQEQKLESGTLRAIWDTVDGQTCCFLSSSDGENVTLILLETAPGVTLSQVIARHGDPVYLLATEISPHQAVVSLVYPDIPMIIRIFVAGAESGSLSESSEVIGAIFTTRQQMEIIVKGNNLYGWQGYQSYQAYVTSEFEVTAEP